METEKTDRARTIREAVSEGLLVDVTELAKKASILHPTFMTPFMVAKYEAQGSHGLLVNLMFFGSLIFRRSGYDLYGPVDYGDHVYILEPNDEFGHVVLILEAGRVEELNLKRTTGDRYEYVM